MAQYATRSDLEPLVSSQFFTNISNQIVDDRLNQRSAFCDTYLKVNKPIIAPYPNALKVAVCKLTAYDLATGIIGINPSNDDGNIWFAYYEEAMRWLEYISKNPDGLISQIEDPSGSGTTSGSVQNFIFVHNTNARLF